MGMIPTMGTLFIRKRVGQLLSGPIAMGTVASVARARAPTLSPLLLAIGFICPVLGKLLLLLSILWCAGLAGQSSPFTNYTDRYRVLLTGMRCSLSIGTAFAIMHTSWACRCTSPLGGLATILCQYLSPAALQS